MHFFLIVIGLLSFFYGYTGWRLIIPAGFGYPWNVLAWFILLALLILPFVSIYMRFYGYQSYLVYLFTYVSYLSLGFMTLLFLMLLARDIGLVVIWGIKHTVSFAVGLASPGTSSPDPVDPGRRRFLVNSLNVAVIAVTGFITSCGIYKALRGPRIVDITVPVENLHDDLDGFRILQITDIHVGSTIRRPYVEKIVRMADGIDKDIIFFTGDLADGRLADLRDDVASLAELSAPHGMFFVTGNHEYYSGVLPWIEEIQRLGFTVLNNEHRVIRRGAGSMLIAGVTDFNGGQFLESHTSDPDKAREGAPPCDVAVLLAHQPRSIFRAARAGYDIMVSGHTHGGQYFPWNYFVRLQQPYTSGLHRHNGTWIYVSRGSGYWGPPLRCGVPSEITVITLRNSV